MGAIFTKFSQLHYRLGSARLDSTRLTSLPLSLCAFVSLLLQDFSLSLSAPVCFSLTSPTFFTFPLPTVRALQTAAARLTQSKYLNVGNHFKPSNTEPLSPPCSLSDMDRCQAQTPSQPQTLLISVFDQNVNQDLDANGPRRTAVTHNTSAWCRETDRRRSACIGSEVIMEMRNE